jgi:hypothetical protein
VAYRAEIEIGVKGVKQLDRFQSQLERLSNEVDRVNKKKFTVGNLSSYNEALRKANETLNQTEIETSKAGKATGLYKKNLDSFVTALLASNSAQDLNNKLVRQEIQDRGAATQALKAYNAELAATTQRGAATTMAGSYLRGSFKGGKTQFSGQIGPGEASSVLGGQSSPVDERIARSLALDKERLNVKQGIGKVQESLARLDAASVKQHNARLDLQSNYLAVLRNTTNEAKRASIFEKARLIALRGTSGEQQQGPLAPSGAMGFNVALPMNRAEQKGIDLAQKKLEIVKRTIKSRQQLVGLAGSLQKLDVKAKVAIADTNREQIKTNQLKEKELQLEQQIQGKRLAKRKRIQDAASSGIIGGAFPLLFGQGPAAAVGGGLGGFGGGLAGGQLGFGLSLVGTQIGAAVDQVITSITSLSSSLREPIAALTALEEAGIKVNSSVALQIQQLESAGKAYEAQALLLDTVTQSLGVDAVAQLQALDDAQEQTQQHISDFKAALIAELLPALTAAAQGINVLAGTLTKLSNIKIPIPGGEDVTLDIPKLIRNAALSQLTPGGPGIAQAAFKGLSMLPKPELQAPELTPTQQLAQQTKQLKATTDIGSSRLENEITELIGKNLERNNDLTDATVVANKRLIISKTQQLNDNKLSAAVEEKRLNNAIDSNTLAVEGLQRDKNRNEANNQNLQLTNSIVAAQEAKNKKLGSGASKLAKQNEQLARQEQQARAFTANLERQLAQSRVAGSQQAQKLRIEAKYEQTVERIAKLKNQDSATEQRALADQIRSTALANLEATQARKQAEAIRSAVAPIKGIREGQEASLAASKEYNRLLMEGVLPSEAKRIVEFNKQVEQLLNQKTEAISLLELDIARAQANGATTTALQEQLDLLNKQKKAIEGEAAKGPGKSDTSDKKTIEDRVAQLQGELTELTKLGNVAVAVADNVGAAFGAAFQGVINGSKTTQEALADMLKSVGESFVAMAAEIIVKQLTMIALQAVLKALGGPSFSSPAASPGGSAGVAGIGGGMTNPFGNTSSFGAPVSLKANGGPVSGGQPYMVGERGPELFVPGQSGGVMRNEDMRSLMGRSPASGGAPSMNFSFETTSIGGTEYVSREQLESAMAVTRKQASNDGAKRGMSMTLDKMQNSPRTRSKIGLR